MWLLTHPAERKHPVVKRTGDLGPLCLENCEILVGRDFSGFQGLVRVLKQERCFLLFPSREAIALEPPNMPKLRRRGEHLESNCAENLLVIDGTWEFARQLMNR